jgi:DNA helicase HerA-like ATPase
MSLDILKVKSPEEFTTKFKKLNERLLKPPFILVINGSVRTGKSTLLMNLIYNNNFYKGKFDKIIFISPTSLNDLTLKHLSEDDDILKISENLDKIDDIIKAIIEHKEEDKEEKEAYYLIIFDDMLGYIKPKSYVSFLCSRYRHFKLSLIFTSQNFRSIPPIIRTNASAYLIFKSNNRKEYKKYVEEFEGVFEHFEEIYKIATEEPYNFLFLNLKKGEAYHNFGGKSFNI